VTPPPPKPRPPLPTGPYLVVGLARSGAAVARALAVRGLEVAGCDAGEPDQARRLEAAGVEVHLDVDGTELVERARCVVKSPGVPGSAAAIVAARERGVSVIGELEAAWRMLPNRFIGVTGTNGKTTVTELIGHIYRRAGAPVAVAGNVGTPLAALVGEAPEDATIVCECSSFQLEDSEAFAPEVAVFLNFAPDHLDRHPTLEDYLEAKLRIFASQANEDVAVYNADEPALDGRDLGGCARRLAFCRAGGEGKEGEPCEVALAAREIFWVDDPLVDAKQLPLLGEHNADNAMAAAAACLAMGLAPGDVREGLLDFPGVPHRLERVAEIGGALFVNDSKATNVAAATASICSFEGGVHVILGGSLKGESFEALVEPVAERCAACYLIGEAAESLESDLATVRDAGVQLLRCDDLEDAVRAAADAAGAGDVILLAPACASFDAFRDFEQRGERFREIVEELAGGDWL
jgi:UDP-N-acetylmuramoylalanine--D-glutamate ligase